MIKFLTCAAALALVLTSAAARAEVGAALADAWLQAPSTMGASGYRIDEESSGFQLVSHGVWQRRPDALGREAVTDRTPPPPSRDAASAVKGSHSSTFRRASYLPHVLAAEARFGLPPGLLDALIWTESRYNPQAMSKAGAAGLGQLMLATARDLGVTNRFDPLQNVAGAARYLRQMLDKFGVVHLALAAYNAGPAAVERARGIPLNGETPAYVRGVLTAWQRRSSR